LPDQPKQDASAIKQGEGTSKEGSKNVDKLKGYNIGEAFLKKIPKREKMEYAFKEGKRKNILRKLKGIPLKKDCPFVLITPSFRRGFYGVCNDLADSLLNCNFNVMISHFLGDEEIDELLSKDFLQGIVLSGGNDITSSLYGGKKEDAHKPDLRRDNFEITLYRKAVEKGLPVLAVCRGLQVINVAHGGSLKSNLRTHKEDKRIDAHILKIKNNSLFKGISLVNFLKVGTSHHQAIDKLGKDLISITEADDGIIEMVEVKNYPLIATQFHPERSEDGKITFKVFKHMVYSKVKSSLTLPT